MLLVLPWTVQNKFDDQTDTQNYSLTTHHFEEIPKHSRILIL